jgi:hypothetical protein
MYNYMDDVNEADIRVNHKKINGMNHSVSEATGSASFSGSDESRRIWVSLSFSCNFGIEKTYVGQHVISIVGYHAKFYGLTYDFLVISACSSHDKHIPSWGILRQERMTCPKDRLPRTISATSTPKITTP